MHVVTLIAKKLTQELVDAVSHALTSKAHAKLDHHVWVEPKHVCDIFFTECMVEEANAAIGHVLDSLHCDYVVQSVDRRKKKMLITDMDSTMIEQECIDEIADFAGIKAQVAAITERAMNGELDFQNALKERVKLLAGLSEDVLQKTYDKITLMPGAKTLVSTMRWHGAYCVLVSGGFTFFTKRVSELLGFQAHDSNTLIIEQGKITGEVRPPIRDKNAKAASLTKYTEQQKISKRDVLAIGDGANDIPMLQAAGLGVAYHAKPAVQKQIAARINHSDLTALLYAQGYKKEEFRE